MPKVKEKPPAKQMVKESGVNAKVTSFTGLPSFRIEKVSDKGVSGILQNVRISWVHLQEPQADRTNPSKGSYSVTAILPKSDAKPVMEAIFDAVKQHIAVNKRFPDKKDRVDIFEQAKATGKDKSLLKFGDDQKDKTGKIYDGLANSITLVAKQSVIKDSNGEWVTRSGKPPFLTFQDKRGQTIEKAFIDREFYSGVVVHLAITFAVYDFMGKGVSCYLNGVRKVVDAPRLGNTNPFANVAASDDDSDSMPDSSDLNEF